MNLLTMKSFRRIAFLTNLSQLIAESPKIVFQRTIQFSPHNFKLEPHVLMKTTALHSFGSH